MKSTAAVDQMEYKETVPIIIVAVLFKILFVSATMHDTHDAY